jgi:hypothetical protein
MSRLIADLTISMSTLLLWMGALLLASLLLGSAMKRRRESLTSVLKDHVGKSIGSSEVGPPTDTKPPPGDN